MLTVSNLKYIYNQITYQYSLELKEGEIVAVMGESGSGKSTLLDLLCGFLTPLSGTIMLNNQEISKTPLKNRDISILFQNDNLFEHLSIKENLTIGVKKDFDLTKILKEVGLNGYENKTPDQLSGGEQQRVALARTLIRESKILLLDEPFSALDTKNRHLMLELVKKITVSKNLHTIFITHNKEDVSMIADKVYQMSKGVLLPQSI
ncbi:MAG: thiamine ABC transporter ATP-binding protein [Sulfurospirillum sp.]|nr:MAG: thiamine ABC transporter ATP-binding protein [Sulfurospirillum sp.]